MKKTTFLFNEEIQPQEESPINDNPVDNEASEQISDEPAVEVTDEVTEEAAEETTEEAAEETTEEASEESSEQPAAQTSEEEPQFVKPPYHERYYLLYNSGKNTTPLDLDGTKNFLQELGFDGGELKRARLGKACSEQFKNTDGDKGNTMHCSYCGREISGVEFFRLPDGRLRCNTCSSTVIKTKAEVEELCQRVLTNMANFFGATIDVAVAVEVVDEKKLKKKVGLPLGDKDSQSILILGVAINKKKKYSIILENGAPRISVIATFAHELTHIWQYTHWDNNKDMKQCPKSNRLVVYEGMAKWAEIQYLYLIGETAVARREEYITRNRQDEYGKGFLLYEERYPLTREAMTCEETPFTPDGYPLD